MAIDFLEHLQSSISSPPAQFALAGLIGGLVFKFFKSVGDVLNDSTNRKVSRWLKVKNVEAAVIAAGAANWPDTFSEVFDRIFGKKHLSWKCFARSLVGSYTLLMIGYSILVIFGRFPVAFVTPKLLVVLLFTNALPDYLSLLQTRWVLSKMERTTEPSAWSALLLLDYWLTAYIALIATQLVMAGQRAMGGHAAQLDWLAGLLLTPVRLIVYPFTLPTWAFKPHLVQYLLLGILPAFFTSLWLWLYAGAGFIVKGLRRFDIAFEWFTATFDIEKKPFQSIGLVAGAIVTLLIWALASGFRLLH